MFDEFSVFKSNVVNRRSSINSVNNNNNKLIKSITSDEPPESLVSVKRKRKCLIHHHNHHHNHHHHHDMPVYTRYSTNSNEDDDDDESNQSHTSDEDDDDEEIESEHEDATAASPESMFSFLALWESLSHLQPPANTKCFINGNRETSQIEDTCCASSFNNQLESRQRKLVFKQITKRFSYNIGNIVNNSSKQLGGGGVNKSTLLFFIEWNCSQIKMMAPFDLLAYSRLTRMHMTKRRYSPLFHSYLSQNSSNKKLEFNYLSVKRLKKLLAKLDYDPLHEKFIKKNSLLLNCVTSQLSPYYLDIFRMSELQTIFDLDQIEFMKEMRNSYNNNNHQHHHNRSYFTSLTDHLVQNIVWNCLVLYKFKLYQTPSSESNHLLGGSRSSSSSGGFNNYFINFYLSFFYIRTHMELVMLKIKDKTGESSSSLLTSMSEKLAELDQSLPHLLDALVLTGHFTSRDYHKLERFCIRHGYTGGDTDNDNEEHNESSSTNKTRRRRSIDLTAEYYRSVMKSVQPKFRSTGFPLRLKDLCRIRIRNSLSQLDASSISQLTHVTTPSLDDDVQSFLLFDNEIRQSFIKKK